jgi:hypothetical protein
MNTYALHAVWRFAPAENRRSSAQQPAIGLAEEKGSLWLVRIASAARYLRQLHARSGKAESIAA